MYIETEAIVKTATLITALTTIIAVVYGLFKWVHKRKETTEKVEALETREKDDIKSIREMHNKDMQMMSAELCVVSYGLLAALDGLKQLGCNGEVTKAHDKLSKHINQQAHDQL